MSRASKAMMGAQIRAARALLRWTIADLAKQSGVSLATIHRAEIAHGKAAMTFANASAVRNAFEAAGVEILEENGAGPGARFKEPISENERTREPRHAK
jgi:transcriptional regulator with XRE-family HTH domain